MITLLAWFEGKKNDKNLYFQEYRAQNKLSKKGYGIVLSKNFFYRFSNILGNRICR